MYRRMKRRAFQIVTPPEEGDRASRVFDQTIYTLIALTSLAIVLETIAPIAEFAGGLFHVIEVVTVAIFSVEYVLRLWTCTENPDFAHPVWGRVRYAFRPLMLADLLAVVPFYVPVIVGVDLRFARVLRLLRLLKLTRYSESMSIIGDVLQSRRDALISTTFVGSVLLLFASGLMYLAERDAQPEGFSSIPAAMWWGMVTLTTVGYGDLYPVTPLGRGLGAVVALLGIGLFALPAGILGSAFVEELDQRRAGEPEVRTCPHCGEEIHDDEGSGA
ncbi:MAG: ion transporter [Chloroflexi bacterium]|nr:ion transporter [Chloroflexota bacterium]